MRDPCKNGIEQFGASIRAGEFTIVEATKYYLQRIEKLNPRLQAFEYIATNEALAAAGALDNLLQSGTDLGPLMGVPIGVKDIITVAGMPVLNGSYLPSDHFNGEEGTLIKKLKANGCVILGKTKTVEFALGATGINEARGTPWNPWDAEHHRIPGGSSSGSAVATASGMCAFALGTDTGGSIRIPASYNGLFGHKTSMGLWPTDGVFPLCPTLDSIGPICRSAKDALLIHQQLFGGSNRPSATLNGVRLAKPQQVFFDALDTEVQLSFAATEKVLLAAGAEITEIDLPQSAERNDVFPYIVGAELIATLGAAEFEQARSQMDTVTAQRASVGLTVSAEKYINSVRRHRQLQQIAANTFDKFDAWISPTVPMLPMSVDHIQNGSGAERALLSSRNTQLGNLYGLCATSIPVQHTVDASLPAGFQFMMPAHQDHRLLQLSIELQKRLGIGPLPDVRPFES